MRVIAYVLLVAVIIIMACLLYYLVVGALLFKIGFSRRNLVEKRLKKNIEKKLKKYNVDLCWWEKQKVEKVFVTSFDGYQLAGFYLSANSDKTVLITHGFGGSHWQMQQYAKFFHDKNFNVLSLDNRAHGESEGGCVGFGQFEKKDIVSWVNFLNEKTPLNQIVLFGISMGATSVLLASDDKDLKNVVAIISDAGYANASNQIDFILKKYKLSLKILKKHLYSYAKRLYGLDILQIDATKSVNKAKVPILFIHGGADDFVDVKNVDLLYNSSPQNLREKYIVEDAEHIMAYPVAGVLYEKKISDFLKSRTKLSC